MHAHFKFFIVGSSCEAQNVAVCQISAHLVKSKKLFRLDGRSGGQADGQADGGEWRIVLTGLNFSLARFWPVLATYKVQSEKVSVEYLYNIHLELS